MPDSVRFRLVANSMLLAVASVLVVGVVTLFLLGRYFRSQERVYLQTQVSALTPTILQALVTGDPSTLQRATALTGYTARMRVQLHDNDGRLLADSGSQGQRWSEEISRGNDLIVGAVVDESGRVISFGPPIGRQRDASGNLSFALVDPARFAGTPSFTDVSSVVLQEPILYGNTQLGLLTVSDGPAVGTEIMRSIYLALIGGSAVALILAFLIGWRSARQVNVPLGRLAAAAAAMGEDLDARAPASDLREFDALGQQLNRMAGQLTANFQRLHQEREVLRRTITDAGHELRTPITALKTFNTLLQEDVIDEPESRFLKESANQIWQLERLTDDMLDLSRLESRQSGTQFVVADLRESVNLAIESQRPALSEAHQTLTVSLPSTPILVLHDPPALERAVSNLLHNAIKFTGQEGQISVAMSRERDEIRIAITDNGPGIQEERLERIFDRFYRGPDAGNGGSGLGLAIAREVAVIHEGDIEVRSEPHSGSTFTILFPAYSS